jgi:S-disulfanyl-L-cysteine oxidoreductase SoxD
MRTHQVVTYLAGSVMATLWLAVAVSANAPEPPPADDYRAIWKGVYTEEQAVKGKVAYSAGRCVFCHLASLAGGADVLSGSSVPGVKGNAFLDRWADLNVRDLFNYIRDTMPRGEVNFISDEEKLDIVAYILKENGFPSGALPLTNDRASLEALRFVKKDQVEVSNFAAVRVTGCLALGSDNVWSLTNASAPVSAVGAEAATGDQQLGTNTFRLLSMKTVSANPSVGQKVQATGFLYRAPGKDRLDLTSLRAVKSICGD